MGKVYEMAQHHLVCLNGRLNNTLQNFSDIDNQPTSAVSALITALSALCRIKKTVVEKCTK